MAPVRFRESLKLALSMTLFFWLALWMDWDLPKYGALAIALISLDTTGASLRKGVLRLVGTTAGLAIGMFGLAFYAQDSWLTLAFLAAYLLIVSYSMQASEFGYAWFVAGFLPPLVWSTTYGNVDSAFHYATSRFLETSAGVVIYTAISSLLWPRRAGDSLKRQGRDILASLRELFALYSQDLDHGGAPAEATRRSAHLAGSTSRLLLTIKTALTDTPSVRASKPAWETLGAQLSSLGNELEIWRESINDLRRLSLDRLLPHRRQVLESIDQRLALIERIWTEHISASGEPRAGTLDHSEAFASPEISKFRIDHSLTSDLSHFERAALAGFVRQLRILDQASCNLLVTVQVLSGSPSTRVVELPQARSEEPPVSLWDPPRFLNALFPPLCFALAFVFWIHVDPPTGPSIPLNAAVFSLLIILMPMSALRLMMIMLIIMWCAVAPVYLFVMPRLDSGVQLLTLIFIYTFAFTWIGDRKPALKSLSLALFVTMTGISNSQSYSFMGLINAGQMYLLSFGIIATVQLLVSARRPEYELMQGLRRLFQSCSAFMESCRPQSPRGPGHGHTLQAPSVQSFITPVLSRTRAVESRLDFSLYPTNSAQKVRRLLDALQSVAWRLQSLEHAKSELAQHSESWSNQLAQLEGPLYGHLQRCFERLSLFEVADLEAERTAIDELDRGLQERLNERFGRDEVEAIDDDSLARIYGLLGCTRGLIDAVTETRVAADEIDWELWAEARF